MLCPNCDTRNDSTARFCRICGAALQGAQPQPAASTIAYRYSDSPPSGPVCPSCARPNPTGARYCVYCAAALVQPAMTQGGLQPVYAGATTNVYVMPQAPAITLTQNSNVLLSLLLRAVWFVMIGWWLGLIWTIFAWLFNLTIIGLPVGLLMLNAIPQIMTLAPRRGRRVVASHGDVTQPRVEHPFLLRAIWFFVVGWWASLLWMITAWAFSASILLLPIAFWMFNRVPTITTLAAED